MKEGLVGLKKAKRADFEIRILGYPDTLIFEFGNTPRSQRGEIGGIRDKPQQSVFWT